MPLCPAEVVESVKISDDKLLLKLYFCRYSTTQASALHTLFHLKIILFYRIHRINGGEVANSCSTKLTSLDFEDRREICIFERSHLFQTFWATLVLNYSNAQSLMMIILQEKKLE